MTKVKLAEWIAVITLAMACVVGYAKIKSDIEVTKRENLIFPQQLKDVETRINNQLKDVETRINNRLERIEMKVDILIIKEEL